MTTNTSDQQTLWDLIKDIKFGMLTHRHTDGMLHSHPLTT
ncbi:MAG: general stress protein, partial [Polaromonas sp.]|nr:general stress protein [Polaromonas sp.]